MLLVNSNITTFGILFKDYLELTNIAIFVKVQKSNRLIYSKYRHATVFDKNNSKCLKIFPQYMLSVSKRGVLKRGDHPTNDRVTWRITGIIVDKKEL